MQVVGPGAVAAAMAAETEAGHRRDQVRDALGRDLEAARYAADRAFRQSDAADPVNRLVAGELETRGTRRLPVSPRWKTKSPLMMGPCHPAKSRRSHLAAWPAISSRSGRPNDRRKAQKAHRPHSHPRGRRRYRRCGIRDRSSHPLVGGAHTELRLPRRRGVSATAPADIIAAVRHLVLIANDE